MIAGQKRYYSLREIYRRYVTSFKRQNPIPGHRYDRRHRAVRQYLGWLKEKSLTIYALTRDSILEFTSYMLTYQSLRSGYLTRDVVYSKMKEIYLLHQWAVEQGIMEENKFSDSVRREVRFQIRSRADPPVKRPVEESVPAVFADPYEELKKMDDQKGYQPSALREHRVGWQLFLNWVFDLGKTDLCLVDEKDILSYQQWLKKQKSSYTGRPLSGVIRMRRLTAVKKLFEYLRRRLRVTRDPTHVIDLPKCPRSLPRTLMSRHEVEKLVSLPDVTTAVGIRDRAIMEIMYSSGLRANELCHLKMEDILFQEGMVRVLTPKGGAAFERVIPVGDVALEWIKKYLTQVRPTLLKQNNHPYLFLHERGGRFSKQSLITAIKLYRIKGGFKKQITSHSFRVTCATEMLRGRADIRYVQAQLGHSSLSSTQIYARVLPTDLKKVHRRSHPRERRKSPADLLS